MIVTAATPARLRWGSAGLIRVSTDPGGLDLPGDLDLSGSLATVLWLKQIWGNETVTAALAATSPALCRQVEAILSSGTDATRTGRAAAAVASYLLRWQRRATPFGLFAGVGPARVGTAAVTRCGTEHRISIRADSAWLDGVVGRLHRCPQLLDRLPVVACNAITARGARLVAPGPAPDDGSAGIAPIEVSVRATGPVRAAIGAAAEPIPLARLHWVLASRFPAATPEQIGGVLTGLVGQGLLITALRVPMTVLDAFGAVCDVLRDIRAEDIPEAADLVGELYAIRDLLATGPFAAIPAGLAERMAALNPAARSPLLIDTAADCEAVIPEAVVREARDAADVLYRLSPHPFGHPIWRDYHTAFRSRYGTGALVPVLDLVSDAGLGLPAEFLGSVREQAPRQLSERDEKMMALVQAATVAGGEIELTDALIGHLMSPNADRALIPPRTEVAFEIHAASIEDLNRGRFALEVTGTPRPVSSMVGRHAHLLPAGALDDIEQTFRTAQPGQAAAQLSFVPRQARSANVARTTALGTTTIPIAEHRRTGRDVIDLADLAVTADDRSLHLIRISTGEQVHTYVANALEAASHTPPLARFLAELPIAGSAVFRSFSFGAASQMPYLPRVRYRRTVLSPARWQLRAEDLPDRRTDTGMWEQALSCWRNRWHVPDHVAIVDHDRCQPIDLRHPAHRTLLRTRLARAGALELRETAPPQDAGWIGRAHEVLLPLVHTAPADARPGRISTWPQPVRDRDLEMPGASPVVAARLFAHPDRFDEILTAHLPALLETLGDAKPLWWFYRHRNHRDLSEQHLALFVRSDDADRFAPVAAEIGAWADGLHRCHLSSGVEFTSWQPPAGRYGQGTALEAAIAVFHTDSRAALAQLRTATSGASTQVLAAVSFLDLAAALAGDLRGGMDWLLAQVPQIHGPLAPALRADVLAAAVRHGPAARLRAGDPVAEAWSWRAEALGSYSEALSQQRDPISVLPALLHLHHLRAVGTDPDAERVTGRLARALVLRTRATGAEDARPDRVG
jgi:thiopeptide-type bacteriocin biosynthesis protein